MTSCRGRALRLTIALSWCAFAAGARAQTQAPAPATRTAVLLRVSDCFGASGARVNALAALELAPHMTVLAESATPVLTGEVQCDGQHASITVSDRDLAQPLHVRVDLAAAAPEARERLLALALSELITTRVLEHNAALAHEPAHEPANPPAPELDVDEPTQRDAPFQLWVAPSFSLAALPTATLFGADIGGSRVLGPLLLALDLQAQFGQSDRAASDVALRLLSACIAIGPVLIDDGGVQLSIGGGLRVGHAQLSASSARTGIEAGELSGIWLGPAAVAALQLPLLGATGMRIALEAGAIARPIVGLDEQDDERLALRGLWVSASAGVALRLP